MKTVYAVANFGVVNLEEKTLPELEDYEVLLEAAYSTMSPGTEHALMENHIVPLPQPIGYSMSAYVRGLGKGVTKVKIGDSVVTTGEHAKWLVMNENNVTPAPKGVDMMQAAFFNLAHTGMYAIRRTDIRLGEPCVVLGQGLVGSITAQLAKLAGALPVIAVDLDDGRLARAKEMGIHHIFNIKDGNSELKAFVASLGYGGVPVVFEATGAKQPLDLAFELVSERGRVMMMSQTHENYVPQYSANLMQKGATLIGGYINSKPYALKRYDLEIRGTWPPVICEAPRRYAGTDLWTCEEDITTILNLIYYGSLDLKPLITHHFKYTQMTEAYDLVWHKDPALIGGVIEW